MNLIAAVLISLAPLSTPFDPFVIPQPGSGAGNPPLETPCIFLPGPQHWLCPAGIVAPPVP